MLMLALKSYVYTFHFIDLLVSLGLRLGLLGNDCRTKRTCHMKFAEYVL